MDYQVEDLSSVKKKVRVQVPEEEGRAALAATVALYRKDADIKGFRKGKVPSSVIENRFKKQIYSEATTDLINTHINEIMNEMQIAPLSRIEVDAKELVKGEPFEYSFSFEVAPEFELPEYKGLKAEEREVRVVEEEIQEVIDRVRENLAEYILVDEPRKPQEGEAVVIDFQAYKDGQPIEGVKAENFQLTLGEGNALPDFEELVKEMEQDQEKEKEITLPEDFLNPDLAGKPVLMRVKLKSIKEKRLPEVDDELAQKAGGFESVAQMREVIENSYTASRKELNKSEAQKEILDELKAQVEFELPESVVQGYLDQKVQDLKSRLERRGKSLESSGKSVEEWKEEMRPEAEDNAKAHLFLLAVANNEDLSVDNSEIDAMIQKMAQQSGQNAMELKQFYEENNLMFALKDRILADKAMDLIYESADITLVPPEDGDGEENPSE
ncbi:MAG: trigger factor [Desulfonatronovibrionaceae bacterium]